jgi:hypothetical protein
VVCGTPITCGHLVDIIVAAIIVAAIIVAASVVGEGDRVVVATRGPLCCALRFLH